MRASFIPSVDQEQGLRGRTTGSHVASSMWWSRFLVRDEGQTLFLDTSQWCLGVRLGDPTSARLTTLSAELTLCLRIRSLMAFTPSQLHGACRFRLAGFGRLSHDFTIQPNVLFYLVYLCHTMMSSIDSHPCRVPRMRQSSQIDVCEPPVPHSQA